MVTFSSLIMVSCDIASEERESVIDIKLVEIKAINRADDKINEKHPLPDENDTLITG